MWRRYRWGILTSLMCASTIAAHLWIAQAQARRLAQDAEENTPLIRFDPPTLNEVFALLPDETESRAARIRTASSQAGDNEPADAALPEQGATSLSPRVAQRTLTKRERDDLAAVRAVIEEEMAETSAEERDIWYEELKSLPAEVVRDLLQVRRQLRVLTPEHSLSRPSPLQPQAENPRAALGPEIDAEPVVQRRQLVQGQWSTTRSTLEQAANWTLHNLANVNTPGYKRVEVHTGDIYHHGSPESEPFNENIVAGQGCRLMSLRHDFAPGDLRQTEHAFDLAIDGPGLLILKAERAAQDLYTRSGRLRLDDQRRLCLEFEQDVCLLQPVITLPSEMVSMNIAADGTVSVRRENQDGELECGRIQLALFPDPSRLTAAGDAVFLAGSAPPPRRVNPGTNTAGLLRQGFLEQSNVSPEREQANLKTWQTLLRSLPGHDMPRTARESHQELHFPR